MAVGSPKIEELRARLQGDPKSRMFLPLAEELRKAGHLEEAERVLNQGISAHPSYLSAWVSLGRVLLARGNPNGAADAANRALKIDPENIVAARVCADAYLAAGEKVEAIKKYKLVHAFLPTDLEIQAHIEELDRELNPESHIRPIAVSQEASPEFNVLEQTEPVPSAEAVDLAETRAMPQVSLPWEETAPESPAEYETSSDQQAPSGPSGANDLAEEARTFLEAAFAQPATDEDDEDTLSKRPRPAESAFTDAAEAPEMWTPMQDGSEEEGSSDSFEELSEPPSYLSEPMRAADVAAPEWEPLPPEAAPIPPVEDFAETLQEPEPEIEPEPEPQEDLAVASEEPAPLVDAAALAETQYIQPVPEPETANRATIARLEGWLRVIRKVDE